MCVCVCVMCHGYKSSTWLPKAYEHIPDVAQQLLAEQPLDNALHLKVALLLATIPVVVPLQRLQSCVY